MTSTGQKLVAGVLGIESAYAIVRYHVIKGVAWAELPVYTANKVLAWAGLTLVALAIAAGPWHRLRDRPAPEDWPRECGRFGAVLVAIHVLLSIVLTTPAYFPKWFTDAGTLALWPGVAVLTGAIATAVLAFAVRGGADDPAGAHARRLRSWTVALTAMHVAAMGWDGWLAPADWPGLLPPITLLSLVVALGALVLRVLRPHPAPG